ncbi:MAG: hypothetical protein WCG99_03690 [Candidatus Berkelbacteria bacterium]
MKQTEMSDEEFEKHLEELARFLYELYRKKEVRKLVNPEEDKRVK